MASASSGDRIGGRYCCIPGCSSCSWKKSKVFLVPSTSGKRYGVSTTEWAGKFHQVIFRYRYDSKFKLQVQNGKAHICSRHFADEDIQVTNHKSNLKFGALPKLHLPQKSHTSKAPLQRRMIKKHELLAKQVNNPCILSVSNIMDSWRSSKVERWRIYQTSPTSVHLTYYRQDALHAAPSASVLISERSGKLEFSIAFQGTYAPVLSASLEFGTRSLEEMLDCILDKKVCSGYPSVSNSSQWSCRRHPHIHEDSVVLENRYFSESCEVAFCGSSLVCNTCMALHVKCLDNMDRRMRHKEKTFAMPLCVSAPLSKCRNDRLQSTVILCRKKYRQLEKEVKGRGVTLSESLANLVEKYSTNKDDDFLREWWSVQKRLQETGSIHGRRYPPSVIKYCLMLYNKSPSAYRLAQKIMVLPSSRTLRQEKLKSLNRCKTGFQNSVASRISQAISESEKFHEQFIVVCIDEMTIKEDLVFQSSSGNVIGFVDYDSYEVSSISASSENVASHMLAIFIRGVTNKKLDGVIAYYPTTGVSTYDLFMVLSELLVMIPVKTSATIVGVVFDGLPANRSVMKMLCRTEEDGSVQYRMENPVDTSRYIYFVPDPPHLLKTARNNLINSKKCMWNGDNITMQPIKDLVREDIARGDLRFYPHLTESHLSPTPWEKMNVKIAAQTLSYTLGTALRQDYPALSQFLLNIDKWFDIMNAGFQGSKFKPGRRPVFSVDDERLHWLENEFLNYLDVWQNRARSRNLFGDVDRSRMLLSVPTEHGLRIATKSMVAIIKECLSMDADYVLPRRINQDPLEAYFGQQRQAVSRGDTPSVALFSATARSIEILPHANMATHSGGNVCLPP